jgi:TolA-binding protein
MKQTRALLPLLVALSSLLLMLTGCEKSSEEMYKKAMSFYEAGKYHKAVQLFEALLARYPEHSLSRKAQYQLGNIYFYKLNQPEQALNYAQKLYEQSPQGKYAMQALELIGYIYDKSLNRCLDGAEAYRLLLKDYAAEVDAGKYQLAIADCYFKRREYPQAIAEYTTLTERYPQSEHIPRARFQIATSYALTEVWEEAVVIYEELLQIDGLLHQFVADIQLELAYCYGQQEEYDKALKLYEELEELDANDVSIDKDLIARKKEHILKRLAELNRKPQEVDWSQK